jgi:AcrR family transcriptional regulator
MPVHERRAHNREHHGAGNGSVRRAGSLNGSTVARARMMRAMVEIAGENGYAAASVSALLSRARVSSKTFYEHFSNADDCFIETFDECLRDLQGVVVAAYQHPGRWAERIRAAMLAALSFLEHDRPVAVLLFLEAPKVGAAIEERRARVVQILRLVVDAGRAEAGTGLTPPEITNEVVVEGAIGAVRARLAGRGREHGELLDLVNPLMGALTYCYLGSGAAGVELDQPSPVPSGSRSRPKRTRTGLLTSLPIRMTYRTVSVLSAIAENPGASNREVADAAGIRDQGQISRLLSRLAEHELIRNDGGQEGWAPKGWHLTMRGREVERVVRLGHSVEATRAASP